ncbi:MAG: BamA/TamA family outer membrane protein [Candidatus Azobacteroides sp.]|nr:BamA/TamA family outer membrane protein [Candidatus Azobacteroides sp.]
MKKRYDLKKKIPAVVMGIYCVVVFIFNPACSPTKYIPEGQYFLNKVDIQMDDKGTDKESLLPFIQQRANSSGLAPRIYNMVKNDSNFIKRFVRKLGEPPAIFQSQWVSPSISELEAEMNNRGYFNSLVSAQVDTIGNIAEVIYHIHNGEPYRVRNFQIDVPQLRDRRSQRNRNNANRLNRNSRRVRIIREGSIFSIELLEKERIRLSSTLQNLGYYTSTKENLHYLADTTLRSNQVDLTMIALDSLYARPYTVQRVNVYSGYDPFEREDYRIVDSVEYKGIHIYYDSLHFLRPKVIAEKVMVAPEQLFRERQREATYNLFQSLNCMGRVDIQYGENLYPDSTLLDCNIYLTPGNSHSLQTGLEGTNKAGNLGVALDVNYGNLNIFNGSEIFNIHLRGAYEFVSGKSEGAIANNYYELEINPSLTFPKLHFPFIGKYVANRFSTQTQYSLGYNIQQRPEYMRNFFNFNWKIRWESQRKTTNHSLSLLDINYVNMPWKSELFQDYLNNYVDSLTKLSYDNVFTAGIDYGLIYTNTGTGGVRQNLYTIRFNAETSGNLLNWYFKKRKASKSEEGQYRIFGNPFAQYAKGEIDFSETFSLNPITRMAFHWGIGAAYPYGNSDILPFEKRFYAGGPNSVRGWSTRYLGPGSYNRGIAGDPTTHVGDIKLIMSAEYRLKVLSWLEPALFVDAGNIWTIKDYPNQPDGLFRWNQFYKEIAVGIGFGLRFDLNFLLLRLDAGTRVYDPARDEGKRMVLFKDNLFRQSTIHLAIGYPF